MTVSQIYKYYQTPQSLQKHMLNVASIASILLDNWRGIPLDKDSVIQACTFHDIAKPMCLDLNKQSQFGMSTADVIKLEKYKIQLRQKYGKDEHKATVKMCKEIGCNQKAVELVNNLEWNYIPRLLEANDVESLIPIYCDMRIGPNGILSLSKRLSELEKRVNTKNYKENVKNGNILEKILKQNIEIDIDSITNNQINKHFKNLLNTEI